MSETEREKRSRCVIARNGAVIDQCCAELADMDDRYWDEAVAGLSPDDRQWLDDLLEKYGD